MLTSERLERDADDLPSVARYVLSEHAEDLELLEGLGLLRLTPEARVLCAYFVANRNCSASTQTGESTK